jgi:hypothetical protein
VQVAIWEVVWVVVWVVKVAAGIEAGGEEEVGVRDLRVQNN